MKTKLPILLNLLALSSILPGSLIAQDPGQVAPNMNYDVHREYDENGNLIYYDSTTVISWDSDSAGTEYDSLMSAWQEDSHHRFYSYSYPQDSFSYRFRVPGDLFDLSPGFDFSMEFPEIDDILKSFEYNFSVTPSDTSQFPSPPDSYYFDFHGTVPELDPNFSARMRELEQRMYEMQQRILREFELWDEDPNEFYEQEPQPGTDDSEPEPQNQSLKTNNTVII
jgi:hypothetical protein